MFTLKGKIGLLVSCLVAVFAIASCGGGTNSPLDGVEAASSNQVVADNSQVPDVLISEQMPTLREVSGPAPSPGDFLEIDPIIDWFDHIFLALHDTLSSGDNVIDVTTPTYKNSNTSVETVLTGFHVDGWGHLIPEYGDALVLASEPGEMAYATFGFSGIPSGEEILSILAHGYGSFGTHDGNGLYIGIGNMDDGMYKWFGPYAPDAMEYEVSTWGMDTANSSGRGYVTFAVYNGDQFTLTDMQVTVGERFVHPGFDWDLIEIGNLLPPGGYFAMDMIDPSDFFPIPDPMPGI